MVVIQCLQYPIKVTIKLDILTKLAGSVSLSGHRSLETGDHLTQFGSNQDLHSNHREAPLKFILPINFDYSQNYQIITFPVFTNEKQ